MAGNNATLLAYHGWISFYPFEDRRPINCFFVQLRKNELHFFPLLKEDEERGGDDMVRLFLCAFFKGFTVIFIDMYIKREICFIFCSLSGPPSVVLIDGHLHAAGRRPSPYN